MCSKYALWSYNEVCENCHCKLFAVDNVDGSARGYKICCNASMPQDAHERNAHAHLTAGGRLRLCKGKDCFVQKFLLRKEGEQKMAATTTRTYKVYEETRSEWGTIEQSTLERARVTIQHMENMTAHKQGRAARVVDTVRSNGNDYIITWYTNPA